MASQVLSSCFKFRPDAPFPSQSPDHGLRGHSDLPSSLPITVSILSCVLLAPIFLLIRHGHHALFSLQGCLSSIVSCCLLSLAEQLERERIYFSPQAHSPSSVQESHSSRSLRELVASHAWSRAEQQINASMQELGSISQNNP